ncbi:Uncharacterized protein DAT39_021188 [Clarias magur]|uniref:Uncharacterized protein n=1 Tax=Clarias magur TaxID=1594786 RepID=A0A8J4WQW0_CLAMG|nr:Uncharacterized protein DAT39_021188 [Clarias magur]
MTIELKPETKEVTSITVPKWLAAPRKPVLKVAKTSVPALAHPAPLRSSTRGYKQGLRKTRATVVLSRIVSTLDES